MLGRIIYETSECFIKRAYRYWIKTFQQSDVPANRENCLTALHEEGSSKMLNYQAWFCGKTS